MMKSNNDQRHNRTNDMDVKDSSPCIEKQHVVFKQRGTRSRALTTLCAISCLTLASIANAAVYYVDVGSGNDSNSGTSQSSAWAHLPGTVGFSGSGWVTIRSGDTVLVKGGTVNNVRVTFESYYSGSSSFNSILIQSGHLASSPWGSGQAVFDGQYTRTGGFMINATGITVDGFEIRQIAVGANPPIDDRGGSACIGITGANFVSVKRCWLHDTKSNGPSTDVGHGIEMSGGSDFVFTLNHVGPGIQMKGMETYRANNGVISSNYFSGVYEHCIAINTSLNWDICNNVIRHDPPYGPEPSFAMSIAEGSNLDVWNNLVFRSTPVGNTLQERAGLGIGMYAKGANNRFVNNTIANFSDTANGGSHETAICIERGSNPNSDTVLYNNIVYNCFNMFGGVAYCVSTDETVRNIVKYCNFWSGSATDPIMDFETGGSDNLRTVANFSPSSGTYTQNQQVDPVFTKGTLPSGIDAQGRPNSTYFQLTTSSPSVVRNTGNAVSGDSTHGYDHSAGKFNRDILGNTRSAWSMGAYEFGGSGPSAPQPPSGLRIASTP